MDKVFVITVCRNAGELLEPTIQSVLNQTYAKLQFIIVDGGSTDGSLEIIKNYSQHIAAWVSEPDKGIYDAMNKGIRMANSLLGDDESAWINFMNAGDVFTDDKVIEDVFKGGVEKEMKVIVGHFNRCSSDEKLLIRVGDINYLPAWMPFCHQATFVRLGDCLFDTKYKIAADYHLFYNLYFKYGNAVFKVVDRCIADFLMNGSTTYTNLRETKKEILKIQARHKSWFWLKEWMKWRLSAALRK